MTTTWRNSVVMAALTIALACVPQGPTGKLVAAPAPGIAACPADNAGLTLPPGFCATVFADGLGHARHLAVAPNGVLYVNTWSGEYFPNSPLHPGGFLVALKSTASPDRAGQIERFGATPPNGAGGTGIAIWKSRLYAEINDRIERYDLPSQGITPRDKPVTVVSGLPLGGDHPMHPFIIDATGNLFVDVASASNACQARNRQREAPGTDPCRELETRGGIWRFDANATNQKFSAANRYATGIRNAEGLAQDAQGHLYVTQHGRDQLHSSWPRLYQPEEEATLPAEQVMQLQPGADYGWPYCYFDPTRGHLVLAPEYGGDGGKAVGRCAEKVAPLAVFPAHWGPNDMLYYGQEQFPARYRGGLFIAFHGSWDRAPYPQEGYNLVYLSVGAGAKSSRCEIFADGFAGADRSPEGASHRPAGLAIAPDGALFVSDDARGRIYRITYRGGDDGNPAEAGVPCPAASMPTTARAAVTVDPLTLRIPQGATRETVERGARLYRGEEGGAGCVGCHGAKGGGSPLGPDLTDGTWLWSDGSLAGIRRTIEQGVAAPRQYRSPMPALGGGTLDDAQLSALAAFVWGLSQPH